MIFIGEPWPMNRTGIFMNKTSLFTDIKIIVRRKQAFLFVSLFRSKVPAKKNLLHRHLYFSQLTQEPDKFVRLLKISLRYSLNQNFPLFI